MGRSVLFILLAALLTGCPGGGDGGGAGSTPAATPTPTQTIVSGSVQAPAGQIAFFKERSWGDGFVSEAYSALTDSPAFQITLSFNSPDSTLMQVHLSFLKRRPQRLDDTHSTSLVWASSTQMIYL